MIKISTLKARLANIAGHGSMSLGQLSRAIRIAKIISKATGESVEQLIDAAAAA